MSVHSHPFLFLPLRFYSASHFFFGVRRNLNEFAANRPILNGIATGKPILNGFATICMKLQAGGRMGMNGVQRPFFLRDEWKHGEMAP